LPPGKSPQAREAGDGPTTLAAVLELAEEGRGKDESGYRTAFLTWVKKAQASMVK
jgi:hypothetical protein